MVDRRPSDPVRSLWRGIAVLVVCTLATVIAPASLVLAMPVTDAYVYDGGELRTDLVANSSSDRRTDQALLEPRDYIDRAGSAYDRSRDQRASARLDRYRSAPNTAGRAAGLADDGVNVLPSSGRTFVGTPRGTIYDVPQGWAPRVADNGRGIVYQRPGAFRNADSIRIMEPTSKYPSGYVRYYNSGNQPLDVFGNPGADPVTHIPQDYVGPWPGWPL